MGRATVEVSLTPALSRAARGFLGWTQEELAARSTVSRSTIRDFEGDRHGLHRSTEAQLLSALKEGGVMFVDILGCGTAICGTTNGSKE
ncbi:helix-turn-helix transcriptional regulator [Rhizobium sp. PRIMUS64]|uniref:helix-turn-helix domain-containing protein n=1 Tax=Rhizobium TaxID=379 RepID=UPI001FF4EB2B|nr:helix-turn-helix domain-containing protein [Rhizobium sp. PRIMUS64]MCJ9691403.1 helix-turn-helix transcriptional regulator [Rhizobium sp. PRIMUS64]